MLNGSQIDVSVIIPTYRRPRELCRAIDSVLAQTLDGSIEVIVIVNDDDGNSSDAVNSYGDERLRCIHIQNNGIIAKSRNAGVLASRGKLIAFCDDDDYWHPEKLTAQVGKLNELKLDLIGSLARSRSFQGGDAAFDSIDINAFTKVKTVNMSHAIWRNPFITSSIVCRRDLFVGDFCFSEEPEISPFEDYHFWLCCLLRKRRCGIAMVSLVSLFRSSTSTSPVNYTKHGLVVDVLRSIRCKKETSTWIIPLLTFSIYLRELLYIAGRTRSGNAF